MGMFDKEVQLKNAEFAQDGADFVLRSAEYLGRSKSAEYGENAKARVMAAPDNVADPAPFVVFGVMAEQIERMDSGDLPARVRIGKDGRANVIQLVDKL